MDARRDWERRLASDKRTTAYAAQRTNAASERFTRDDAGMAYGTDGALALEASRLLTDAGYQWDGRIARTEDDAALGGYDVEPNSAPMTDEDIASVGADWAYDGTLTPITFNVESIPALMRERPDGNAHDAFNRFRWSYKSRLRLGGRNRRDGRNLVRTALAVGVDGAVLRTIGTASDTDAAYAYAIETARAMRTARLAHAAYVARERTRESRATERKTEVKRRAVRVDEHVISADLTAMLERARAGTSER